MIKTAEVAHFLGATILDEKNCLQCMCCDMLCYADNNSGDVYCLKAGERVEKAVAIQVHSCANGEN